MDDMIIAPCMRWFTDIKCKQIFMTINYIYYSINIKKLLWSIGVIFCALNDNLFSYMLIRIYIQVYSIHVYIHKEGGGGLSKMIAPALAVLRKMRGRCANEIAEG